MTGHYVNYMYVHCCDKRSQDKSLSLENVRTVNLTIVRSLTKSLHRSWEEPLSLSVAALLDG